MDEFQAASSAPSRWNSRAQFTTSKTSARTGVGPKASRSCRLRGQCQGSAPASGLEGSVLVLLLVFAGRDVWARNVEAEAEAEAEAGVGM